MVLPLEREHDDNSMHSMMTFVKIKRICIITMETRKWLKEHIQTRAYPWEGSET